MTQSCEKSCGAQEVENDVGASGAWGVEWGGQASRVREENVDQDGLGQLPCRQ